MAKIIICSDKDTISLPVEEDGTLNLYCLKTYFENASGLVYDVEDIHGSRTEGLLIKNNQIIINPEIKTYRVRYAKVADKVVADVPPTKIADQQRKDKVNMYRKIIEGKNLDDLHHSDEKKRIKLKAKDIKNISSPQLKEKKKIKIGWKHRHSKAQLYQQQKKSRGGVKEFELDTSIRYSVEQIIEMAVSLYDSELAVAILQNSKIELGFNNNEKIESFSLPDGKNCGIWGYYQYFNIPASRMQLYLLSTTNSDEEHCSDPDSTPTGEEEYEIENFPSVSNAVSDGKTNALQDMTNTMTSQRTQVVKDTTIADSVKSKFQRTEVLTNGAVASQSNFTGSEKDALHLLKNNYNKVQVLHWYVNISKYSGAVSISETDKTGIYWKLLDDNVQVDANFNPIDYAYEISRISINYVTFYEVTVDESISRTYILPKAQELAPHSIVHDIDEINGFSYENFGIGLITCTAKCKPLYSWYCNNILYRNGILLMWLYNIPVSNTQNEWYCKVKCTEGCMQSKTVIINGQECSSVSLEKLAVLELSKEDFKISNFFIGAGQQGKLFKGSYLEKDVAVKSIKIFPKNMKLIEREIAILKTINHENFISLFGVCKEVKQVHLVMELFDGKSLNDVIYDEELKELYKMDDKRKTSISSQICKAITFLHLQENPIIHRDIKPENIMVNVMGLVKICDFGLSKFSVMCSALKSTVGRMNGTAMYMAPELLLQKEEATTKSDVWAVAATITELFQEDVLWDVSDQVELENMMTLKIIPDIDKVPIMLQGIIIQCFSYNFTDRPPVSDIMKCCDAN